MTELPDLPPHRSFHRPVPTGGLAEVLVEGRRRRRAALGAVSATTSVLALVLGLALLPGTDNPERDSLQFASPQPLPSASSRAAEPRLQPSPTNSRPAGSSRTEPVPSPTAVVALPPGPARPTAANSPDPNPEAPAEQQSVRPDYLERPRDVEAPARCVSPPDGTVPVSCAYAIGAGSTTVRQGEPVEIGFGSCNPRGSILDAVLEFDSGREHQMTARVEGGPEVFRFSDSVRYPQGAHERRLAQGRCLEYRNTWRTQDARGRPVPAGTYQLSLRLAPDRVNGQPRDEGTYSIRVTVTD